MSVGGKKDKMDGKNGGKQGEGNKKILGDQAGGGKCRVYEGGEGGGDDDDVQRRRGEMLLLDENSSQKDIYKRQGDLISLFCFFCYVRVSVRCGFLNANMVVSFVYLSITGSCYIYES